MKAVIIAGGKGTRIAEIYPDIPKPMIPVDGVPVLEREIECLRQQGVVDIIVTVQHKAEVIMNYFGDGSKFGVHIQYYKEKEPLGNAGALFRIRSLLDDDFLLLNADSIFYIDFERLLAFHKKSGGLATIVVHPNDHPYDSGLVSCNEDGCVKSWLPKEAARDEYYRNLVNAGIHILSPDILDVPVNKEKIDLDRDILMPLVSSGVLYAYQTPEYVKDMGTPERLQQVESDFQKGIVSARNLRNKQKAIFLDRDGTINKYVGFLRDEKEFDLLEGVPEAIKIFHALGYLVIVVTNQPVVARGEVTVQKLERIHMKMETLLGQQGAYIDGLYYCPHHPDSGFDGEIKSLKIDCECRKPKPGMLLQAAKDFNIDLHLSWMVGDSETDMEAGKRAGCRTCYIGKNMSVDCDETFDSVYEFACMWGELKGFFK